MGYIEILTIDQTDLAADGELPTDVIVGCSPDEISTDADSFTDWMGGYMLTRSLTSSRHDGHPATLITLHDSGGDREVGRLVLRNDALRDARLEIKRVFDKPEQLDSFAKSLTERPAILDDEWVKAPARSILVGDLVFLEGDLADDEVNDTTAPVTGVETRILNGRIVIAVEIGESESFHPISEGVAIFAEPEDSVWVKRAGS